MGEFERHALNMEDLNIYFQTDVICADCSNDLIFTEEIVRIQVVQPYVLYGELHMLPVVDDEGEDFIYDPYHFHLVCWENMIDDVRKELEDKPPLEDPGSSMCCRMCGSGIRDYELSGCVEYGELHRSRRAPEGLHGTVFHLNGTPDLYCMYCLYCINNDHIELWDSIGPNGECPDCLEARCWRTGTCDHECHYEEPEEE